MGAFLGSLVAPPSAKARWAVDKVTKNHTLLSFSWEINAKVATLTGAGILWLLLHLFGWSYILSFLITSGLMLPWAIGAAIIYCRLRADGAPDIVDLANNDKQYNFLIRWSLRLFKFVVCIGFWQWVLSHIVKLIIGKSLSDSKFNKARRRVGIGLGTVLFGVTSTHNILTEAQWKKEDIDRVTIGARLLNAPVQTSRELILLNTPGMMGALIAQLPAMIHKLY